MLLISIFVIEQAYFYLTHEIAFLCDLVKVFEKKEKMNTQGKQTVKLYIWSKNYHPQNLFEFFFEWVPQIEKM